MTDAASRSSMSVPGTPNSMPTHVVRTAVPADLEVLAAFEIDIAKASFPANPLVDPRFHVQRLRRAMDESEGAGMLVVEEAATTTVVGWAWVALRQNSLTGERYAAFRSLAARPGDDRAHVAELLMEAAISHARSGGVREIIGKVAVANAAMRVLYRKFGFTPRHLTMQLGLEE